MAHEWLDVGPVDKGPRFMGAGADSAWQQPAQHAARAGVDADHPPGASDDRELDVIGVDQPARVNADDAAVEHVLTQQDLALPTLEGRVAEGLARQQNPAGRHLRYPIPRHEQPPSPDARDQARDGRVPPPRKANDDVVHLAQVARRADETAANDLSQP